jgi:hypothetical protein
MLGKAGMPYHPSASSLPPPPVLGRTGTLYGKSAPASVYMRKP